jgi:excisionase family DNA binding protein
MKERLVVAETLSTLEAAEYLGWPAETLRKWRQLGTGPRYVKAGNHVRYRKATLDRWLEQREREAARGA